MVHKAERLPVTLTIGSKEHKYNIEVEQVQHMKVVEMHRMVVHTQQEH